MKHIGIIGSRKRNSLHDLLWCIRRFFEVYEEGDVIVSGGCPKGGDKFAEVIAKTYNIPIILFPPDWDTHGRVAGFIRNTDIAEKSDVLIAMITKDRGRSKGTMNTVNKVMSMNKTVILDDNEEEFDPELI